MHQTRQEVSKRLPIQRKGTKYVARARSHVSDSVTVVFAVREILKLARTMKEVKKMVHEKILKINHRPVNDCRESIKLFNILEAGKSFRLSILPTGKFYLEEIKDTKLRLCKVVSRKLIKSGLIQLNMHDGTNVISKDKIKVGDSVYLDSSNKISKHIPLDKGSDVFVISGKYSGKKGKITSIENNNISVKFEDSNTNIDKSQVVVL